MTREERLKEIAERAAKATPGPWEPHRDGGFNIVTFELAHGLLTWDGDGGPGFEADAEFIENSRSDVPWLLSQLSAADAENARLRRVAEDSKRDGHFTDRWGACKVCDGEIPDGHTHNCDIWKIEKRHRDFIANEYNSVLIERDKLCERLRVMEEALCWLPMQDAPRDSSTILVLSRIHGVMEARFEPGEWSDSTPDHPAEYSGAVWVCGDDFMQIEVEELPKEMGGYHDGELIGWLPRAALASGSKKP